MNENSTNSSDRSDNEIDLSILFHDFFVGLLKFWWLVALLTFIFGLASFIKLRISYVPYYTSQATFTVSTQSENSLNPDSNSFIYDSATAEQIGLTFPHILSSDLLVDAIKEDLKVSSINGTIQAKTIQNSNMVTMYVTSSIPEDAKIILESAIKVYPTVSRFVIGETKFNMIDPPNLPKSPSNKCNYKTSILKGAIIGFALSLIIIVLYAFFRKTVHRIDTIQKEINLPCLISFPLLIQKKREKNKNFFPTVNDKNISPLFKENIESLKLRIEKDLNLYNKKVLLVTSTESNEGKSLISSNLAFSFAKSGKKVLLIDGDLRKQDLYSNLKYNINLDLTKAELNPKDINKLIIKDSKSGIYFLGGYVPFDNPSHFLANEFNSIVNSAKEIFDYIIIDSPPAKAFEDALILSGYSDAVLYVVKQDYAPKSHILETMTLFDSESASSNDGLGIIGFVFNGIAGILGNYGYNSYNRYGKYTGYGKYGYSRYGYGKYGYSRYGYGKYGYYQNYGYGYGSNDSNSINKESDSNEK